MKSITALSATGTHLDVSFLKSLREIKIRLDDSSNMVNSSKTVEDYIPNVRIMGIFKLKKASEKNQILSLVFHLNLK